MKGASEIIDRLREVAQGEKSGNHKFHERVRLKQPHDKTVLYRLTAAPRVVRGLVTIYEFKVENGPVFEAIRKENYRLQQARIRVFLLGGADASPYFVDISKGKIRCLP